ncbi:MAG TPA: exo-alpha-sialidase [Anaerolineae bacterium]|nr:exo-alpha-sialidase [Anaerolineae bacterium]
MASKKSTLVGKKRPAPKTDKTKVLVFVGTRKGGFIFSSDPRRKEWKVSGPHFKGWNVMHVTLDPRDRRLHAATAHAVYGPTTHYSDDLGKTWTQAKASPAFPQPSESGRPLGTPDEALNPDAAQAQSEKVIKVWNITPGRPDEPDTLYAGIEPAALFKSTDRGATWSINAGLYNHPHRPTWFPGNGGLCLHTIILDPNDSNRMYLGLSTGGCYRTDDGGVTWQPRNKNVRADFLPDKFPEYGQCLHKMVMHPARPEVLYQQNHCGVYRSDNAGDDWIDIGAGRLPSRFGFPVAVHPHDPKTIYLVLEESDEYRMSIDGKPAVWRSKNGGETWKRLSTGLPERGHLVALREAMAVDTLGDAGVYVGTNTGQVFHSRDAGDAWGLLADFLPPVLSVETAVIH